jgi:hypothetical protein
VRRLRVALRTHAWFTWTPLSMSASPAARTILTRKLGLL